MTNSTTEKELNSAPITVVARLGRMLYDNWLAIETCRFRSPEPIAHYPYLITVLPFSVTRSKHTYLCGSTFQTTTRLPVGEILIQWTQVISSIWSLFTHLDASDGAQAQENHSYKKGCRHLWFTCPNSDECEEPTESTFFRSQMCGVIKCANAWILDTLIGLRQLPINPYRSK